MGEKRLGAILLSFSLLDENGPHKLEFMKDHAPSANGGFLMPITPAQNPVAMIPAQSVEQRFRELEHTWREETGHLSSYSKRFHHPAFQEIIRLGEPVVPLMLRDLEKQPGLWVWALPVITGDNPVPNEEAGKIARMSEAWVRWGKEKGYRW